MDDEDFVGESDGDTEEEAPEPLLPPPEQQQALHTPPQQLELEDDVVQAILPPVVLSEPQTSGLGSSSLLTNDDMSELREQGHTLDTSTDGMRKELAELAMEERSIDEQHVGQDVLMIAEDAQEEPVAMDAGDGEVDQSPAVFSEGDLVEVQSRTWPGINKPGGSGRIVRVHQETDADGQPVAVYDVRYVLGGLERRIDREYVELSSILQDRANARKSVGRLFYHDEYAPDKQKRTREVRATTGSPNMSKGVKRKRSQRNDRPPRAPNDLPNEDDAPMSDSSANIPPGDGDSSEHEDDPDSDHKAPTRLRMDDRAFIFRTDSNERPRKSAITNEGGQNADHRTTSQTTHRRVRPIIESDDEDDDDESDGDEIRASDHVHADDITNQAVPKANHRRDDSSNSKKKPRRSRKKRRFVGGYAHYGDDPDANFIQPEDNANSLPDDVAREIRFNIKGKTTSELKALLHKLFAILKQNIERFETKRSQMKRKLKRLSELKDTDIDEVYTEMLRLHTFLVDELIHAGEDVMNIIIQRLTKKKVSLADAIDLEFDGLKVTLNSLGGWTKTAKILVEEELSRRGRRNSTPASNDFVDDDSSDGPVNNTDYYPDSTAEMDNLKYVFEKGSKKSAGRSAPRQSSAVSRRDGASARKTAKNNFVSSTTLDDYDFVQFSNSRQSMNQDRTFDMNTNLRFTRRSEPKAISDPRWNWLKMANQKQRRAAQSRTTNGSVSFPGLQPNSKAPSKKKKRFEDSVQQKRFQLRNQRYQNPRPGSHYHRTQTVPNSIQFQDEAPNYGATTYGHEDSMSFARSASTSRKNEPLRPMPAMESKPSSLHQRDWSSIFEFVSREFEDIVMFPLPPEQKLKCSTFGHQISTQIPDILLQALDTDDRHGNDVDMACSASSLRQKLSEIRFTEQEFIHSLMDRVNSSGEDIEDKFKSFPEWISLLAIRDDFHQSIAKWTARALQTSRQLPIAQLTQHLRICVFEISQILRSLPDCNSLFSSSRGEYVFFFEVADRTAKATPVLSAITHTYWYCVQLITTLKSSCDKMENVSASDKGAIDSVFAELLPMRVILATARFLVDLYLYMPASHRWNDICASQGVDGIHAAASIPAISLWILMFDCFDSGTWSLQQASSLSQTNEKDFWALLQTMHRHHFLEQLAMSFVRGESCGGYLHEVENGNKNNADPKQEELKWTSQLLASESAWDLCFILSNACASTHKLDQRSITSGNEAKWSYVKDLLHPSKHLFLPFDCQADASTQAKDDFASYSQTFKELVLQRILLLSKLWLPLSDIVELLFDVVTDAEQQLSLPKFVESFLELCEQVNMTSWNRQTYIDSITMESSDPTESICKITLVMLMKLDKRIDQLRFRKSILGSVDSRHKKTIENSNSNAQPSTSSDASTKTSTNWNWGGTQPVATKAPANKNDVTKQASLLPRARKSQTRLLVSMLLVVAAADMCYNTDKPSDGKDKRSKSSKGNWGFYCKELTKLLTVKSELGSICEFQALYVMGTLALRKSTEYAIIFSSMNDHLRFAVLALREGKDLLSNDDKKLLADKISAALQLFRDLTTQLCQLDQVKACNSYDVPTIEASIAFILNTGLEICFDAAIDKESFISVKQLNVAIAILQLLHPQAKNQPAQSLSLKVVASQPVQEASEFGEFDDIDDSVWASVDLDTPSADSAPPTPILPKFTDTFLQATVQSILSHLRGALQRLVFHYPSNGQSTSQELYMIDLLGAMISTCTIPFSWNARTFAAVKSRFLAPRLLSAVLKYHPEKDWFSTCFLSESGAAQLLANMWITGTLDIQSLLSNPCRIEEVESSYSLRKDIAEKVIEIDSEASKQIRYANYWLMLSDGIIFNVLRENSVVRYKADPLLLQLLQKTASTCKFVHEIRLNGVPSDLLTLLDVHLDMFRAFCEGCGEIWRSLALNPSANRMNMNQFRSHMLDLQSGIFVTLTEVYDINLKMVSQFLDDSISEGWNALSAKFLEEFSAPSGTTSYHSIDESTEPLKERKRLRLLVLLFKFMYANVDCFLFHCGEMATGQQNIFFTIIDLMFRQARCADFPQAQLRFRDTSKDFQPDSKVASWSKPQRTPLLRTSGNQAGDISPACESFVENVRLFFARQKYPSLFHWFAQNLEHYQTLGMGWRNSKMRILLLNVLDPLGPLGIDSYYPIQAEVDLDVGGIKREAFYLACGLFICNHGATLYQHCRAAPSADASSRMQKMRTFVLNDFMWETFNYAQSVDKLCVLETLVPVCQFIRAVLSHCNMNTQDQPFEHHGPRPFHFNIAEIYPCIESITLFFVKSLKPDIVLESVISCVLLIELSGIAIEALIWTEKCFDGQASQLLELVVMYFGSIYKILKGRSSSGLDTLFGSNTDQTYLGDLLKHFPSTSIFDEVLSIKAEKAKAAPRNTYGISEARVRSDLLSAIRRLVVQCQKSSNEFIRNLVVEPTTHPLLGGTM